MKNRSFFKSSSSGIDSFDKELHYLKILFLGHANAAEILRRVSQKDHMDVEYCSDCSSICDLVKKSKFDIILIDSTIPGLEEHCIDLFEMGVAPVVLLINEAVSTWKSISHLPADGFIPISASDNELLARIKAACRRGVIRKKS